MEGESAEFRDGGGSLFENFFRVIILGAIGRNFAAAMSGGIAYVFSR